MKAPCLLDGFARAGAALVLVAMPVLLMAAAPASGQPAICAQIRAELASLPSGGPRRDTGRLQAELNRTRAAMQQNDCNRQGFLVFGGPPPVCGPLRAQAAQLQAQINAAGGGGNARRNELVAALGRYSCNAPPEQRGVIYAGPREPSLFDRLFGIRRNDPGLVVQERPLLPAERDPEEIDEEGERKERLGGNLAVCVRTCDGYFFPVNFEGMNARQEYEAVCQALCPAAETQVYFIRLGAEISTAATRGGEPYMSLPTANKFRETYVEGCTCKPPGQTWASLATGMDDIVEARRGDIVVNAEQAIVMSRPKEYRPEPEPPQTKRAQAARKKLEEQKKLEERRRAEEAAAEPQPVPESSLPTGGSASAGIGPKIQNDTVVGTSQGRQRDVIGADGVRRQVRVVAPVGAGPELLPGPGAAIRP